MSYFFSAAFVNSAGLLLDILGVVLLYKYGLPEEISRKGTGPTWTYGSDEKQKKKAKHYDMMSLLALGLLVFGFALQILSNWL